MNLRLAAYELSARHTLDSETARQLLDLSGVNAEPHQLERSLTNGLATTAAFLGGAGIIFLVAANWDAFGRFGHFALLQSSFVAMAIGAAFLPRASTSFAIAAFMAMGGLFAYFGQTYQTGADPWQLFAAWSLLSLPICFATKADSLWTAWCWVTMTGIALWTYALVGHGWHVADSDALVFLQSWGISAATCALLSPLGGNATGAGKWSFRSSIALAATGIALTGLGDLLDSGQMRIFLMALAVLGVLNFILTRPGWVDVFNLSVVGLALDALLIGLLAKLILKRPELFGLVMVGLMAAAILGGTVNLIVLTTRRTNQLGGPK